MGDACSLHLSGFPYHPAMSPPCFLSVNGCVSPYSEKAYGMRSQPSADRTSCQYDPHRNANSSNGNAAESMDGWPLLTLGNEVSP